MEFKFTPSKNSIRTIKPGDRCFKIRNGFLTSDRAAIEIGINCPDHYARVVLECYNRGWIKPVANVTEKEYTLLGLANE